MDGTETDNARYRGVLGEIRNADGSLIENLPWANLYDGRAVLLDYGAGSDTTRIRFRVFTLIRSPAGQPAGSIGATARISRSPSRAQTRATPGSAATT